MLEVDGRAWQRLIELIQVDPDVIQGDYRGRGMYGRGTIAIPLPSRSAVYEFFVAAGLCLPADEARELALHADVDELGFGVVLYWPGGLTTYTDDDTEEHGS